MSYTLYQISEIQLKGDKALYRLGSIATDDMLYEESETLDYERDIIFLYKKATEWADDYYIGYTALDKIVERLGAKVTVYDYGTLSPIYSDSLLSEYQIETSIYVQKSTVLDLGAGLIGNSDFQESVISVDLDFAYIKNYIRDYYVHDQQSASSSWVVTHNMNKFPSVNIVDTANDDVIGEIRYNNLNQITISLTSATSGKAYLN